MSHRIEFSGFRVHFNNRSKIFYTFRKHRLKYSGLPTLNDNTAKRQTRNRAFVDVKALGSYIRVGRYYDPSIQINPRDTKTIVYLRVSTAIVNRVGTYNILRTRLVTENESSGHVYLSSTRLNSTDEIVTNTLLLLSRRPKVSPQPQPHTTLLARAPAFAFAPEPQQ